MCQKSTISLAYLVIINASSRITNVVVSSHFTGDAQIENNCSPKLELTLNYNDELGKLQNKSCDFVSDLEQARRDEDMHIYNGEFEIF